MTSARIVRRMLKSPAVWIGVLLVVASLISNLATGQSEDSRRQTSLASQDVQLSLLREGTRIKSEPAICRSNGDRLTVEFQEQDSVLPVLENLAAQRILKAVLDDANDARWIVNGQITEFQGHNYLLLDRVTREAK